MAAERSTGFFIVLQLTNSPYRKDKEIRKMGQMLTIGMKNKCMDEIIQVISKYTQDVTEAKSIIRS